MDFHLDDDQVALQENAARFCRTRWPLDRLGERQAGGLDRAAWSELVELGVTSLMVPEADGGAGLGVLDAAVVFERLGYHLVPGPLLWSTLGALVVPEVADGELIAGGALDGGAPLLYIEHASEVDTLIVLRPDGVWRIERSQVEPVPAGQSFDPLNPVGHLTSLPSGKCVGDSGMAARLRSIGLVLTAAMQLGISNAALDVAVAYSLEREQFGVPIGSFQALKHIMADMYVRVGMARSSTYAAAAILDDPAAGDPDRAGCAAKLLSGEAAVENARASIQVLGGMGFTWEMAPHFLLKRAWVLDQAFGTPTTHALALASSLAEESA